MKFQFDKFINASLALFGENNLAKILVHKIFSSGIKNLDFWSNDFFLQKYRLDYLESVHFDILNVNVFVPNPYQIEDSILAKDCIIDTFSDMNYKLQLSAACMKVKKTCIFIFKQNYNAQIYPMLPGKSSCLNCLSEAGILFESGIEKGQNGIDLLIDEFLASLIILEVAKLTTKFGIVQGNEIIQYNFLSGEVNTIHGLDKMSDCPDCGAKV